MKIAIVGGGFVGRATGMGLRKHGHDITFIDTDPKRVELLKQDGFLAYTPDTYDTITTDITMFCVPTPTIGKSIDRKPLHAAVQDFGRRLRNHNKYHLAVIRSTVTPETTRKYVLPLIRRNSGKEVGKDFGLCMQPEYLREVTAAEDFERPWYILIGQYDDKSGNVLEKVYSSFDAPIVRTSLEEAEFQKYVHNVYNAVKIAFFNEMRIAANANNWNAEKVFHATAESCEGIWNPMYGLRDHGPFDGSCLPKDTRALLDWGDENGFNFGILRAVVAENLKHEKLLGRNKTVRVNYLSNIHA